MVSVWRRNGLCSGCKSQILDQSVQSEQNEILLADRLLTPSNGLGSGPIRVECCLQFDLNSEGRGLV